MAKTRSNVRHLTAATTGVTRSFGADVKRVRLARGLTQKQLGTASGYSESYVSKVESGLKVPSARFAKGCDLAFGTGDLFAENLRKLLHGERVPEWFAPYIDLEARADRIMDFSPVFPMGMLQTEDYARAVFASGALAAKGEDTSRSLAARMERRALLDREDAPRLWVVITESCLRAPVAPSAVMRKQLDHLAEMSDHPRVTLQVMPYAAGPTPATVPFTLLRNDGDWTVYSEFPFGGRAYEDPEYVAECMDMYDLIRARALSPEDSAPRVREISREVYQ